MTSQTYNHPPTQYFGGVSSNYLYATQVEVPGAMTIKAVELAVKADPMTAASQGMRVVVFGADDVTRLPTTKLGESTDVTIKGKSFLPDTTSFPLVVPVAVTAGQRIYIAIHGGDLTEGIEPVIQVGYRATTQAPPNGGTVVGYDVFSGGTTSWPLASHGGSAMGFSFTLTDQVTASPVAGLGEVEATSIKCIWPRTAKTTGQAIVDEARMKLRDPAKALISDEELLLHLSDAIRSMYPSYAEVYSFKYDIDPDAEYEWPLKLKLPDDGYLGIPLHVRFSAGGWDVGINNYVHDPDGETLTIWDAFNYGGPQHFLVLLMTGPEPNVTLASKITASHRFLVESVFIRALPQVQALTGEDRSMELIAAQQLAGTELMRSARAPSVFDDGTVV